ncbi:MAG: serine/threonine protein kinase [Gemmatimonadaceae bacterium]|nr:serine/threonine protein kinase [Gemmatimonadaceae bacterium]
MPKVCPVCDTSYADSNIFCPADGSTLRAADAEGDLIGSVVADRYLVTDLLGEGGMGKVYLARHVRLPLQAAIKVLRPELLKDPASVARFNREAANASRIEHERVARVFDFGETGDGLVYLAMEYVQGDTLKNLLANEGPLSPERTGRIVRQVADGLDAAHRLGIVHRDLKPDNILVTTDESDGTDRCKVVDFGIAKAVGSNEKESGLTRTGFVVGTPEFMSPEQLLGSDIDHRSDVYALALVAYQCLTLDMPFDTNTPDRGMTARLVSAPRPLFTVKKDVRWPPALQQVFDQALDKDPAKRTVSAGAFAKAFEQALVAPAAPAPAAAAPAPAPAAGAPQASILEKIDTPGAARAMATLNRDDAAKSGKAAKGAKPTPVASKSQSKPNTKSSPTPSGRIDVQQAPRRSFRLPRLPLPSLSLILVAAAGWWWYTKQRAPRPSDVTRLVNQATSTADRMLNDARQAASSVTPGTGTQTPAGTPPATGATPPTASPGSTGSTTTPPTGSDAGATAPPTTAAGRAVSPVGVAARNTLDSLTKALDPGSADEETARAAIPALRAVLVRLPTPEDSTWAFIRIAEAHLLLDEVRPACTALRSARASARTMNQADIITRYSGQMGCAQ